METLFVTLLGEEIDLASPIKLKDLRAIKELGITDDKLQMGDLETLERFALYMIQRVKPEATEDHAGDLTLDDFKRIAESFSISTAEEEVDRPT